MSKSIEIEVAIDTHSVLIFADDEIIMTINHVFLKRFVSKLAKKTSFEIQPIFSGRSYILGASVSEVASRFAKIYSEERKKYYQWTTTPLITEGHKDFKHFLAAAEIIKGHDVTFEEFLKAQIDGLKFRNTFPRPCNLGTSSAELRLLEYLHRQETAETIDVDL